MSGGGRGGGLMSACSGLMYPLVVFLYAHKGWMDAVAPRSVFGEHQLPVGEVCAFGTLVF